MSSLLELVHAARDEGALDALVDAIPYCRFLGISLERKDGQLLGKLRFSEQLIGNSLVRALHGGTVGALLESTALFTALLETESLRVPKTINLTVEYLRSGKPRDTYARAELTKLGRRIASMRAFAWQEDPERPVAVASCHFLLRDGTDP